MKSSPPVQRILTRSWRKRMVWGALAAATIVVYILFSLFQGKKEAALSVLGDILSSAMVGIALLLFWAKWLRRNTFFPADEVSFLRRRKLSRKELEEYEADRYKEILGEIDAHVAGNPGKSLFSFLLTGPEQSGKTCFARYVNGTPGLRRKCLALEVPYAAIADNPSALDEVFHWLCEGDESDCIRYRIIVFHAGNSVRQVNELVEKLRIIQERFRKNGSAGEAPGSHIILLMVQFTGRRPLEAISSDFKWDEILDDVFMLNYVSPAWICRQRAKKGLSRPDLDRQLYLHSLGVPEWYNALSEADSTEALFRTRLSFLEHWFPMSGGGVPTPDFWRCVFLSRSSDSLAFRFLANTFLLEKAYGRKSALADAWNRFLQTGLPSMDLVSGRAAARACGEKFFGPLGEAFLLYHGFLPTVFRSEDDLEQKTVREVLEELLAGVLSWDCAAGSNGEYLRRRLLLEFGLPFQRYYDMCGVRLENGTKEKLQRRLAESVRAVIDEQDVDYAGKALALMLAMGYDGPEIAELEKLSPPDIVKLLDVLREDRPEAEPALEWASRFQAFASLCEELYPDRLSPMAEVLFSHVGNKLYRAFMGTKIDSLTCFHRLGQCIRTFGRLACRSQDAFLINKLVELETLRLSFSRPVRHADIAGIVDGVLSRKYAFFFDSKDFLQCRSWLRKALCSVRIAETDGPVAFSLPEYDDGWQAILHPSELWMANHAVQQVFLLSKHHHDIPGEGMRKILVDLMQRLHWYRGYFESSGESLPIVFANELLFAQINFLTYRKLVATEPTDSGWAKLGLDPDMEREVTEFCEKGLVEAQRKAWGPMPTDPQERRRADASCGCRLVKYLLVAFRRRLMDGGQWFVRPSGIPVDALSGSVLFQGKFPERKEFIGEVLRVERLLGGGDGETVRFLEAPNVSNGERGN